MTAGTLRAPYSLEAEQAVLGSMLIDPKCIYPVLNLVGESDFYRADHREIFSAIRAMQGAGVPIDLVTFIDAARSAAALERMGGAAYVADLFNNTPSAVNAEAYCGAVRLHAMRRSLIATGGDLAEIGYRPDGLSADDMTSRALELVGGLQRNTGGKALRWGEACGQTQQAIAATRERRRQGLLAGMRSGIEPIDEALGGIHGPKLILIAARPAVGKTAIVNLIALALAKAKHPGFVASLEMSADQLVVRGIASEGGINATGLAWGEETETEHAQWVVDRTLHLPLWLDFDTYSLSGIQAQAALLRSQHGIEWMVVDHIGLVETQKFPSRNDQIGFITRSLKQLAKRIGIPVIALSQLSRKCDDDKRLPNLSDLRDSGNVEQDADAVIFLHTHLAQRNDPVRPLEIGIAKNRQGRTGWNHDWQFVGATQQLERRP
jgi:replicative DNA helicase